MKRSGIHTPFIGALAGALTLLGAGCGDGLEAGDDEDAPVVGVSSRRDVIPGRYIVMLKPGMPAAMNLALQQNLVAAMGGTVHHSYDTAIQGFAATLPDAARERLQGDPGVELVEPDREVSILATQQNPPWGLDRIDQRTLPLSRSYNYTATGKGVDVYIIDTGIRTSHSEFSGRAKPGFSSINDGRGSSDCNGHGTHVAGTVGGKTYGVAKEVTLYAVRVLSCGGSGSDSGVIAGVDWVTKNRQAGRPAVANMSLGGGASVALDTAVRNSIKAGVTYALAAGNENQSACNGSPSRVGEAITVGSSTSSDGRSGFSNWGTCVDIFAPGSGVRSAWPSSDSGTASLSGTSMASPHVAGVAALYLETRTTSTPAQVDAGLKAAATTGRLTSIGSGSPNRLLSISF